jgi:hypothetical protein
MWMLSRWFSKYATIQELGKIPAEVQKHLTALGNREIYKAYAGIKPVKTLDMLYRVSKKKLNLNTVNWTKYPEIKVLVTELPGKVKGYTLENVIILMKSCSKLRLNDEALWQGLEEAIHCKLPSLHERQLYDVISSFSRNSRTSLAFWSALRAQIINLFCPRHNLQAIIIALIISTYSKLNLLDNDFLTVLEQQVLRVYPNFDGTDTSRILNVFTRAGLGSEEFYKVMCEQAKVSLATMDWFSTTILLTNFVQIGRGDQVADIEKHYLLWAEKLSLQNFASVFYAYARFLPLPIRKETERRRFLVRVAEELEEKRKMFEEDGFERNVVWVMFGLARGRIFSTQKLWVAASESLKAKGGPKGKEDREIYEEVVGILREHNQEFLIN